jgi:putative phosphoribosyl transferase
MTIAEIPVDEREVQIPAGQATLTGTISAPEGAKGVVLFAHGSGSGRHSPRNVYVARTLQRAGLATVLFDLLTREEEQVDLHTREHRFNIPLLGERLVYGTEWASGQRDLRPLRIGFFGASTGSAAALIAAAQLGDRVDAVVSRGGRPDLAEAALERVRAPTLLIVGGNDDVVLGLNQRAYQRLNCEKELEVVPGASHLFEEPGALETVARMASHWFGHHLAGRLARTVVQ